MMNQAFEQKFRPFAERMKEADLPDTVIETFKYYYLQLLEGETGFIKEEDIEPVSGLPDAEKIGQEYSGTGWGRISETVMIKLNGGLGTSMGLDKAKSLLEVKRNLSFLDIIARQAGNLHIPLVFMNSFATQADSLSALKKYPELWKQGIHIDFLQHKIPKINRENMEPVSWPEDPEQEWCPPGHGDIYTALVTSGMLDNLLQAGINYAFISNADNLGAVFDAAILGYFVEQNFPFMMEVADRTEIDKKGGHLAKLHGGQLILRESAQCRENDINSFQDIAKYKYFNTNNLWINLNVLKEALINKNNILGLSLIRNTKTVNPRDENSTPVYQLETAMGSAISVFTNASAIRVPRSRFAPVKTTNDLATIRSDAYTLSEDYHLLLDPVLQGKSPEVELDKRYYKMLDDFEARFPKGIPSLQLCKKLLVEGDIKFGVGVIVKGNVCLINHSGNQISIEENAVIDSDMNWD